MHELSIARDLLETVERTLGSDDIRVTRLNLGIGAATGIVSESLRFAFGILATGTRVHGAEVSIVMLPARSRCMECGDVFEFNNVLGSCPQCGRLGGRLISGDEMILKSIEVADV